MISTRLQGGLGNQMFQIAVACALAKENHDTFGFDFDDCYTPQQGRTSNFYKGNIFKNIPEIKNYRFKYVFTEPRHSFNKILYHNDLLLNGCFQSEKYFYNYVNEIKNLFVLNDINDYIESLDKNFKYTSVHFRRGDYLKPEFINFHSVCSIEYYKTAMSKISNTKFILLSDDMTWVKENFKGENIMYSPFNTELDDLSLMVNCDNNIISNSTFSWWGAYLNKNPNKIIIGPNQWFGPNGHKDTQDILPESWIKI